ncbi:MAG: DUF108 domain-containing protein [Chloroflexi bacterium]|nr:DUF108 domain-containing protein [Chloroflexota bacterium]
MSCASTRRTEQILRVGLIGLGAIGQHVALGIASGAAGLDVELRAVLTRGTSRVDGGQLERTDQLRPARIPVFTDFSSFLATGPQVVVEAASAEAATAYADPILASGASLIIASSAALMDSAFRARLEEICRRSSVRVYVTAGALIGLDALSAAAAGELHRVSLRVVEPQRMCEVPRVVFEGSAVEGARRFPGRLNVAATVALATGGDVSVTLLECPPDHRREITLSARGAFGDFTASLWPDIRADRLSHFVALSLLAALRRFQERLQIG